MSFSRGGPSEGVDTIPSSGMDTIPSAGMNLVLVRGWTDTIPSEGMDTIEKFVFWLRARGRVGGLG